MSADTEDGPADDGDDAAPVRIVSMRATGTQADRTTVLLSDETSFTLPTEEVLTLGLRAEAPVDARLRSTLADADLGFRTREAALRLLAARPRSRRELAGRLRRKDFPARTIARVLDRLEEIGLLNDADFARAWVRDRLRLRPRGRRALSAELSKKGVDRRTVDEVLDEVFEEMDTSERKVADRVADGWLRRQRPSIVEALRKGPFDDDGAKAWRRGLGHLARKGFGGGLARAALERALETTKG